MVFLTLMAKSWCAHPSVSFNRWNSWPSLAKSFCTTRSLVIPITRHLTNAVQMNKGCDHHQHMEDLMALELKEWNRRNVYLIELLILLIVIKFVFASLKESRSQGRPLGFVEERRKRFGWHSASCERVFRGLFNLTRFWVTKGGALVKAQTPHQSDLGSSPGVVVVSYLRSFKLLSWYPVFPSPQVPTFQLTICAKKCLQFTVERGVALFVRHKFISSGNCKFTFSKQRYFVYWISKMEANRTCIR